MIQLPFGSLAVSWREGEGLSDGQAFWLARAAEEFRSWSGVVEAYCAYQELTVVFRDKRSLHQDTPRISARLEELKYIPRVTDGRRTHTVEVDYTGEDLEAVAQACSLAVDAVIAIHSEVKYEVNCLGFQPGFAYLGPLDSRLCLPRKVTPALRVPAGSVAIAGLQTAIYPFASPGGWHILGTTTYELFRPDFAPHARLQPGDLIRFVPMQ